MHIKEILSSGTSYSFEFFPPKTEKGEVALKNQAQKLAELKPSFISVTCGAGGSTVDNRTGKLVVEMNSTLGVPAVPHLTCSGNSREELEAVINSYKDSGISNILALRGDPPKGAGSFASH